MEEDYYTPAEVGIEFSTMYPIPWYNQTPTEQAQFITKVWMRDYLPVLKRIISKRKETAHLERQEIIKRKKEVAAKWQVWHTKMSKLVFKAMNVYGDCCYEYATQLWGEEGPEMMTSGAKEFSDDDEDMLMGEAIYAAFAGSKVFENDCDFIEKIKKYWKKYHK